MLCLIFDPLTFYGPARYTDITWDGRWISYLDTVLQMCLLSRPGTHQSLPVLLESVIIDPRVHPRPPPEGATEFESRFFRFIFVWLLLCVCVFVKDFFLCVCVVFCWFLFLLWQLFLIIQRLLCLPQSIMETKLHKCLSKEKTRHHNFMVVICVNADWLVSCQQKSP